MQTNPALESLLRSQPALWRGEQASVTQATIDTGFDALNQALPGRGWQPGCLTELLPRTSGCGEFSLLLPALADLTTSRWVALVSPPYIPYAPALSNAGISLERTLVINDIDATDTLWAAEQLLRSGALAAVICWPGKTTSQQQRRLQLAAEAGGSWAVTYRHYADQHQPSPAALRIQIEQLTRTDRQPHLLLNICKSRGGRAQQVSLPMHLFG